MSDYSFVTVWRFAAPTQQVWDAIVASERWPQWWPYLESVEEPAAVGAQSTGAVRRFTWRSRLLYRLIFDVEVVTVEPCKRLGGVARGELEGTGVWTFASAGAAETVVKYDWNVGTNKRWMNLIAPLARPVFVWNHDAVMRAGGKGLARHLGVRLLAATAG